MLNNSVNSQEEIIQTLKSFCEQRKIPIKTCKDLEEAAITFTLLHDVSWFYFVKNSLLVDLCIELRDFYVESVCKCF
jgi:hypothetical protein